MEAGEIGFLLDGFGYIPCNCYYVEIGGLSELFPLDAGKRIEIDITFVDWVYDWKSTGRQPTIRG